MPDIALLSELIMGGASTGSAIVIGVNELSRRTRFSSRGKSMASTWRELTFLPPDDQKIAQRGVRQAAT